MRILVAAMAALLMLTGCARQETPPKEGKPVTPVGSPVEPVQAPPAGPAVSEPAGSIEASLPAPVPLPEWLSRTELAPGEPVDKPGIYFMDVATGRLAGWTMLLSGQDIWTASLSSSPDERWIIAARKDAGWLIRRSDGAAFRYDPRKLSLRAGPGVFLAFQPDASAVGGSKCALLDAQVKLIATFTLEGGCRIESDTLFSADGKTLAVAIPGADSPVALVTVATGAVRHLERFTAPDGLTLGRVYLSLVPQTGELLVEQWVGISQDSWPPKESKVRRYTWKGDLRSEIQIPGWSPKLSSDGKLLLYSQDLGLLGQAAVVQEWGADKPLFRVAGAFVPQWLPGGKEMLIKSSKSYQLVSMAGSLTQGPPTAAKERYNPFVWLYPSPDDANLFLTEASAIDRNGHSVREVTLGDKSLRFMGAEWGRTAGGYHFIARVPGGKGYEGEFWNYLTPVVQRPPFPDERYPLEVADPAGECLNLRAEPSKSGKILRCLPTGTRLNVAKHQEFNDWIRWNTDGFWTLMETEAGERGWVAVSTHSVTYAH